MIVFFEDSEYIYQFDEVKSNRIFIVSPAVRGKEERKVTLKEALNYNLVTIDELESKGLKFNKIEKLC